MNKKRALFSIPLAGLALTSVGCGDEPEVDVLKDSTLTTITAFGQVNPFAATQVDIDGAGTLCDINVVLGNVALTGYTGSMTFDLTYANCTDAAANQALSYTYNVEVVPDVAASVDNAGYTINLVDSVDPQFTQTLTCTRAAQLDCTDANGGAWAFTF